MLDRIEEVVATTRRLGLGVIGFHDMLVNRSIPYHSNEAVDLTAELMEIIHRESWVATKQLAEEHGLVPRLGGLDPCPTRIRPPTMAARLRTMNMFAKFDPTTFPMTMLGVPRITTSIDEASSGSDVPSATTVAPMMKGEMPRESPTRPVADVEASEALSNTGKEPMKSNMAPLTDTIAWVVRVTDQRAAGADQDRSPSDGGRSSLSTSVGLDAVLDAIRRVSQPLMDLSLPP